MNNNEYKNVWIIAEQSQGKLDRISFELITRGKELARKLKCKLFAVLFSPAICDDELLKLISCGVDKVLTCEADEFSSFLVEPFSKCLQKLIEARKPEIVLAAATSTGRTLMPYVAIKVNAGLTADCTELDIEPETGDLLQTRPAIGGNILATIKTPNHRPQMATVRPHSTKPAEPVEGRTGEIIRTKADLELLKSRIKRVGFVAEEDQQALNNSDVVVSIGRGIKKAENLAAIKELAELLGGAVGATRDIVDRGWLGYPHQVGLSGKTVTPRLYLALGLSGAIQHLAGMQTAEHVIAINSDPNAQIFQVSQLGVVGDLHQILPRLIAKIKENKSK